MHNVLIAELDCGQYAAACQSNGVNGYPTLLVYKQGQKVSEYRGKREKHALVSFVKQHLGMADHSEL
jgi:thioredoxin domain-containing protein 5